MGFILNSLPCYLNNPGRYDAQRADLLQIFYPFLTCFGFMHNQNKKRFNFSTLQPYNFLSHPLTQKLAKMFFILVANGNIDLADLQRIAGNGIDLIQRNNK